jgi:DNA-nicking Smr family endonuclease
MNEDDDNLFAQEMGKVKPLIDSPLRVHAKKTKRKYEILRGLEEKEVCYQHSIKHEHLSVQNAGDGLLKADGVSSKDIKKLAQAKLSHEIDLHGMTQNEAEKALNAFLSEALHQHIRQISIVHGRGNHSKGKSILKNTVYQWLEHGEFSSSILVVTPATQSKGGACNILLRKSKP